MGKKILAAVVLFCAAVGIFAEDGLDVSGILDSTVRIGAAAGEADAAAIYGIEEYANIRLRADIGEAAAFFGAFNCIAASGISAAALTASSSAAMTADGNYAAAIELERLYFRVSGEKSALDAGLLRLAFGYGSVFSPSDFLNPKNPLYPDARPRAVLGGAFSRYPNDDSTLRIFAAAPNGPSASGEAFRAGLSGERHFKAASVQGIYAFETPDKADAPDGVHRLGLSLKADTLVGLSADILYSLNPEAGGGFDGLAASGGFDYSVAGSGLYFLGEYLFNGGDSVTAFRPGNPAGFRSGHYAYGSARYSIDSLSYASLAALGSFADGSLTPVAVFGTRLFQGMTLTCTAQAPLDRSLATGNSADCGELGPVRSGAYFLLSIKAELRF